MNNNTKNDTLQETFGTVAWLRKNWQTFFEAHEHKKVPSASLIPAGDPTLLFTTAGMVPFKSYFAGTEEPPHPRVVTIQKCLRTTDLESVGKTARHCTFFEMLGNFSFGDYFKKEAIEFAWEFSLKFLKFDPEKIYITVYLDDDEAEDIWHHTIGVPRERIVRLGKKDNWWGPAGDSGPCGPCTELYLDRGPQNCSCEKPEECGPGSECDRFLEYWNLVFNQFHQDTSGELHPLASHGIDTGAGLERIAALMNGTDSVFDTDEFQQLIHMTEELTEELGENGRINYGEEHISAFRVLADHSRSAVFAIADGVHPDNTGRGYVIRRIIRRGLLYARELGLKQPALYRLVPLILEIYSPWYEELASHKDTITDLIFQEEKRFLNTLEQGLRKWEEYLSEHKNSTGNIFSGAAAFRLYDTFGFPLEMTVELAGKNGLSVDLETFDSLMTKQRETAQSASSWKDFTIPGDLPIPSDSKTHFSGYDSLEENGTVLAIIQNETCPETLSSGEAILILNQTCFYAESGGQRGDSGRIEGSDGSIFRVIDTKKHGELHLHTGEILSGQIRKGDAVKMEIDTERRDSLARHHSATHLLNHALRLTLGNHVQQTGSHVSPDYLRFDFSHPKKLSADELKAVEKIVAGAIDEKAAVDSTVLPIDEAKKLGAVAAFGEKYGNEVRVVSMGKSGAHSLEFCGGTHVKNTGNIQFFHILKESSPGAGNRRIEAIAGVQVAEHFHGTFQKLSERIEALNGRALRIVSGGGSEDKNRTDLLLKTEVPDHKDILQILSKGALFSLQLEKRIEEIESEIEEKEKALLKFERAENDKRLQKLLENIDELLAGAPTYGSVTCIRLSLSDLEPKDLRKLGDAFKEKQRSVAVLLGNKTPKGPALLFMANKGAVEAGVHCGELITEVSPLIGGSGGGRPEMAQAGGKNSEKLEEALIQADAALKKRLSSG